MFRTKQRFVGSSQPKFVKEVKEVVDHGNHTSIRVMTIEVDGEPSPLITDFSLEKQIEAGIPIDRVNTKILNAERISLDDVPLNPDYKKSAEQPAEKPAEQPAEKPAEQPA